MKKIITFMLAVYTACSFAQGPIVEGTYLPVAGTKVKQVWTKNPNTLSIPTTGANQVWNYSTAFGSNTDTFMIATSQATLMPYYLNFPSATHHVYMRTPLNNLSDSLHTYWKITPNGMYNVGGYNIKKQFDSTIVFTRPELLVPDTGKFGMTLIDTSRYIANAKKYPYLGNYYKGKIRGFKVKHFEGAGYGSLALPNATFNDVVLAKITVQQKDSIYVDIFNNGTYTYITNQVSNYIDYAFVRNNTFGSSYLMYMGANASNTLITQAWYSVPVDTGTIKGTVFTNSLAVANATAGVAYLYRENSNFAKDDILATTPLDANGNYQFNSIPYGLYRIAIRPDTSIYKKSFITYHNDSTDWLKVPSFSTFTTSTNPSSTFTVGPIHLQYYPAPVGQGTVTGNCPGCKVTALGIPGVGLIVKKKPGNAPIIGGASDSNGSYSFTNLNNGQYELLVDRPGLFMSCTYTFEINGATNITGLAFAEGTQSITATNTVTNAYNTCLGGGAIVTDVPNQPKSNNNSLLSVFPNPYQGLTNIQLTLTNNDNVLLEVYNSLGQKVQTIDNSVKTAGEYKYQFSAKNLNLSNGLYFLKLKTNHQQQVIKLIEQ